MPAKRIRAYKEGGDAVFLDLNAAGKATHKATEPITHVAFYDGEPDEETCVGRVDIVVQPGQTLTANGADLENLAVTVA